MDTQILQGEIEAVQEAVLAVDEKVDELEETEQPEQPAAEGVPAETIIDLAQVVGRLEAGLAQCQTDIAELKSSVSAAQATAEIALAAPTPEPEPEPEIPEVLEVEPEPEPEGEEGESPEHKPNWLERLLLVR